MPDALVVIDPNAGGALPKLLGAGLLVATGDDPNPGALIAGLGLLLLVFPIGADTPDGVVVVVVAFVAPKSGLGNPVGAAEAPLSFSCVRP